VQEKLANGVGNQYSVVNRSKSNTARLGIIIIIIIYSTTCFGISWLVHHQFVASLFEENVQFIQYDMQN